MCYTLGKSYFVSEEVLVKTDLAIGMTTECCDAFVNQVKTKRTAHLSEWVVCSRRFPIDLKLVIIAFAQLKS